MVIVCILLTGYWFVLFARILSSWFPPPRTGPGRAIVDLIHDLTEPVLRPLRDMLPPVRMGMVGLDLSPIVVFIALGIITRVAGCSFGF